jgi:hypothetical protein
MRHLFRWHFLALIAVLGLSSLIPSVTVSAQALDPAFRSPKLLAKAPGRDMESARKTAFIKAELAALQQVLPRFVPEEGLASIPVPTEEQLDLLVEGLEVHDQRMNEDGYVGLVSVQFNKEAVAKFLLSRQVPFTTEKSHSIVLIPVLIKDGQRRLWEPDNIWREVWLTEPNKNTLLDIVVPLGDGPDQEALPAHSAEIDNSAGVAVLKVRYAAKSLLIVEAKVSEGDIPAVNLSVFRSGPIGGSSQFEREFSGDGKEINQLLMQAAKYVGQRYNSSWISARQVIGSEAEQEIAILGNVQNLTEWNVYGNRLMAIPIVRSVELLSLGQGAAKAKVKLAGSVDQLHAALGQSGFELFPMTYSWVIQPNGSGDPRFINQAIYLLDEPLPVTIQNQDSIYGSAMPVDSYSNQLQPDQQLQYDNSNTWPATPSSDRGNTVQPQGIY